MILPSQIPTLFQKTQENIKPKALEWQKKLQAKKKRINTSSSKSFGSPTAAITKREGFKPNIFSKTLMQN